jgi:TATA-binding protein-associated factor Taf7
MKYEHFENAKNLVEQIQNHEVKLAELDSNRVSVNINNGCYAAMSIGLYNEEHEYATMAKQFVEKIKVDLKTRIETLKSMLETL